ncbi:MAG: hypothetical protein F6K09_18345, partial [Merismopedia sp. SIO2A8]|nr:hypothetical protein [Merismopedia sp. SIO2A8]
FFWNPRIRISGWSELTLNAEGLISAHIDYWHCSRFDVLKQHFIQASSQTSGQTSNEGKK